ncbi:MAG: shikimate dehydrogenase [Solirubrobacterales bacterium]
MSATSTLRFGVTGDPVAHSKSPQMHMAAYAALGVDADYQRLPVPAALFDETVRALPASGFGGVNVTIPHKAAALALADSASAAALAIGAANTLTFVEGAIHADNTDAPGLIAAIDVDLAGAPVLVLGAGGTARAAVWALRESGAEVVVVNRTLSRAEALAGEFAVSCASQVPEANIAAIVNTTSVGMDGDGDPLAELGGSLARLGTPLVVDFVYRDGGTNLLKAASAGGLRTIDGHELLARQGALSFAIWFPEHDPLFEIMHAALSA